MQRVDPVAFRQAASRFVTGVAVLTALDRRGEVCGMTANSFVSISLAPPTVLVSVKPGRMHDAISAAARYGVNVLPEDGKHLSRHFAGRPAADAVAACEIVQGLPSSDFSHARMNATEEELRQEREAIAALL